MFEAKGRTAVVSGVANLTAETLLRQGYNVAMCCHSQERADEMAATIPEALRSRCLPMYCMVGEEAPTRALIDEVLRRFGSLDVLVTGIGMHEKACVADTTAEDFQRILDSHVRNVYSLIRLCLPTLLKGAAPRIINFTCVDVRCGRFEYGVSTAAGKAALESMTRSVALEYAHTGLTANCVAVGALQKDYDPAQLKAVSRRIPLGRAAAADDLAAAVCFLASPEASYITGAVLNVSGGAHLF